MLFYMQSFHVRTFYPGMNFLKFTNIKLYYYIGLKNNILLVIVCAEKEAYL